MWDHEYQEPRYRFNRQVGIPAETRAQQNAYFQRRVGKPVNLTRHAKQRASEYGIDFNQIPNWDGNFPRGSHGWRTEEIEHNGSKVRKMLLRGPYDDTRDVILPIDELGNISTVMVNPKNDSKKVGHQFNGNTVHYPEEFLMNHPPSRIWGQDPKAPKPPFVPHTDEPFKQSVLKEHGADTRKEKMGLVVPKAVEAFRIGLNIQKLASIIYALTLGYE